MKTSNGVVFDADSFVSILSYMSPSDITKLRSVCVYWRKICSSNQVWKNLYHQNYDQDAFEGEESKSSKEDSSNSDSDEEDSKVNSDKDSIDMEDSELPERISKFPFHFEPSCRDTYWFYRYLFTTSLIPKFVETNHGFSDFDVVSNFHQCSISLFSTKISSQPDLVTDVTHELAAIVSL